MKRVRPICSLLLCLAAFALMPSSCSTDDYAGGEAGNKGTVTLILPGVLSQSFDSDIEGSEYIPVEEDAGGANPTEGAINKEKGLWFFAFPQEGKGRTLIHKILPADLQGAQDGHKNHKTYSVELEKGEYTFYMTGNISGLDKVTSAYLLEHHVLNYTTPLSELKPGNLPMYREGVRVTVDGTRSQDIDMHLTFLCSKVQLQMKKADIEPGEVKLTQLQLKHVADKSVVDKKLCEAAETGFLDDINIEISEAGKTLTDGPQEIATFYLPEYYTNTDGRTPTLLLATINGKEYTLPLGGGEYDSSTATTPFAGGSLERGVCYRMVATPGRVVSLAIAGWTTETINLNFLSWLRVSRTGELSENFEYNKKTANQILVTSQYTDSIEYATSAETIELECVDKLKVDGSPRPLVIATTGIGDKGRIHFSVNPDIPYNAYSKSQHTGTVKVAIKADNLVKYVDVQYNVTPFLRVSPLEVEIRTLEGEQQDEYSVSFETNLGGIRIDKEKLSNSSDGDEVSIKYDENKSSGTILLQAAGKAKHMWSSKFTVSPVIDGFKTYAQTVSVTVLPVLGDYRIHFIAINDDRDGAWAIIHDNLLESGKPTDGWKGHKIYIYTQYGMTAGGEIPNSVWYFFDTTDLFDAFWPGVDMQPDAENEGWMCYDLPADFVGRRRGDTEGSGEGSGKIEKHPVPGETLIMFNSGDNASEHRYPYHLEPGVPLFDFSNREGWFVYDCTNGYHEFYNEKPDIYLAEFKIYHPMSMKNIDNWYRVYGTNGSEPLKVWNTFTSEKKNNMEVVDYIPTEKWRLTTIKLWSVRGRENKAIIVKNATQELEDEYGILFGGKRFKDNTGYYDGKGWHEGVPDGDTPIYEKEESNEENKKQ